MSKSLELYSEWQEHNGKTVYLEGLSHTVKVESYRAYYPYERDVINVFAEPKNKNSKAYRETKARLGDDWSIDVLESEPEVYTDVLTQCLAV